MDPDQALDNARRALSAYLHAKQRREGRGDTPSNRQRAADDLAEAFEALDGWLSKGGFLPAAWANKTVMPATLNEATERYEKLLRTLPTDENRILARVAGYREGLREGLRHGR